MGRVTAADTHTWYGSSTDIKCSSQAAREKQRISERYLDKLLANFGIQSSIYRETLAKLGQSTNMHITVEAYNPGWQKQFLQIRLQLEETLSAVTYRSIEHVGSTSVVGLAAKPIIDIDIVVRRDELDSVIEALGAAGYECLGERGIPDRYALKPSDPDPIPPQNVYVCVENSQALKNHLLVRDMCRASEKIRERYGTAKLELSKREWKSVDEYCAAKNDILAWVLSHGMTPAETDQIRSLNVE